MGGLTPALWLTRGSSLDLAAYSELDCIAIAHLVSQGAVSPAEIRALAITALENITEWKAVAEIYGHRDPNRQRGVLSGVPILHKDGGAQIKGLPREYGSLLGRGQSCSYTGQFYQTLLDQGCEVVGRSRVPELHMSVLGDNKILGSTLNPWNAGKSMGGSTAGMAALALGAVPVVHGGDSGGSLRVPASWVGCYTLKPSAGTISASPGGTELFGLNEAFVATRSLRDLRMFVGVLSKRALDDLNLPRGALRHWTTGERRVGLCGSFYPGLPVDSQIRTTTQRLASAAEHLGFHVSEIEVQLDFERVCEALHVVGSLDLQIMVNSLTADGAQAVEDTCQPYIARWYSDSFGIRASDIMSAFDTIGEVARQISRIMNDYDFLITPATALAPPMIDTVHEIGATNGSRELNQRFEEIVHFCAAANMSGHPALVFPYSEPTAEGPCGIQIIGRPTDDLGLLEFAELFDRGFMKPPTHISFAL